MDHQCRLYLISPPHIPDLSAFTNSLDEALGSGDVACLQLRLKDNLGKSATDKEIVLAAEKLLPICARHDVSLLLNDRADLAHQVGANGVHIGQSDGTYEEARALLGDDASIGVTCHDSRHLALVAGEAGADYVAFGAFFPTQTKKTQFVAEPSLLTWWQEATTVPCVAIGGITATNCSPLVQAGADFVAVSGAIWNHPISASAGVQAMNEALITSKKQVKSP